MKLERLGIERRRFGIDGSGFERLTGEALSDKFWGGWGPESSVGRGIQGVVAGALAKDYKPEPLTPKP